MFFGPALNDNFLVGIKLDCVAPLAVQDARGASPGDNLNTNGDPAIREFYIKLLRDRGIVSTNH